MADTGIYPLNAARYLFADEPTEVSAYSLMDGDPRFHGVDETTVVQLRFSQGRFAQLGTSQGAAHSSYFRVIGTEGEIELASAFEYVGERTLRVTVSGKTEEHVFKKSDQFAPELLYFSRCILEDKEPEPSGQEGLADVRVIQAITQSASSGAPVKLEPFTRDARPGPEQIIVSPWSKPPEPINAPAPGIA
jgi:predicted dehydrogenase